MRLSNQGNDLRWICWLHCRRELLQHRNEKVYLKDALVLGSINSLQDNFWSWEEQDGCNGSSCLCHPWMQEVLRASRLWGSEFTTALWSVEKPMFMSMKCSFMWTELAWKDSYWFLWVTEVIYLCCSCPEFPDSRHRNGCVPGPVPGQWVFWLCPKARIPPGWTNQIQSKIHHRRNMGDKEEAAA